jgi:hypothetical protein
VEFPHASLHAKTPLGNLLTQIYIYVICECTMSVFSSLEAWSQLGLTRLQKLRELLSVFMPTICEPKQVFPAVAYA